MTTDTVTVKIGGEDIALPMILVLDQLERTWPALLAWDATDDLVAKASSALAFVVGILIETQPELTLPKLKKRLRIARYKPGTDDRVDYDERMELNRAVRRIAVESGLVPLTPPALPAEPPAANPSTETGNTSSPS